MQCKGTELNDNDEIMRHCRQVRDELNRRYDTVDKVWAYIMSLEKQSGRKRTAKRTARRTASRGPTASLTTSGWNQTAAAGTR